MIFRTSKSEETVWDKERGTVLCKFIDGAFETTDKRIISKLKKCGYASDTKELSETSAVKELL